MVQNEKSKKPKQKTIIDEEENDIHYILLLYEILWLLLLQTVQLHIFICTRLHYEYSDQPTSQEKK